MKVNFNFTHLSSDFYKEFLQEKNWVQFYASVQCIKLYYEGLIFHNSRKILENKRFSAVFKEFKKWGLCNIFGNTAKWCDNFWAYNHSLLRSCEWRNNQFLTFVLILYHLKTPKILWFSGVFRGSKMGTLTRNGLTN